MPLVPMVIKRSHEGERSMDLYSRLLDERIIMLTEPIDSALAGIIVSQLLYLQSENASKDITMYINSPGGEVIGMWSIIDTSLILANGTKGKRLILPHAEVMIHQPLGGARGQASDIEIQANQIIKTKRQGELFMAEKTGQPLEKVSRDMDRDYYMTAEEALKYGVVDKIIGQEAKNNF